MKTIPYSINETNGNQILSLAINEDPAIEIEPFFIDKVHEQTERQDSREE